MIPAVGNERLHTRYFITRMVQYDFAVLHHQFHWCLMPYFVCENNVVAAHRIQAYPGHDGKRTLLVKCRFADRIRQRESLPRRKHRTTINCWTTVGFVTCG